MTDNRPLDEDLAEFCRSIHPRLVGSLSLYLYRADVAEELTQETLLRACQHWTRIRDGYPQAWAYRTAFNLAKSWFRRKGAERRATARLEAGTLPSATDAVDGTRLDVRAAVAALPTRQRTVLICRFYLDLPVAAAAEVMGCAEGTVKSLTNRGIASLRGSLTHLEVDHAES